jgi:hypothetical protein
MRKALMNVKAGPQSSKCRRNASELRQATLLQDLAVGKNKQRRGSRATGCGRRTTRDGSTIT